MRKLKGENRVQRFLADNVLQKCLESCGEAHHVIGGDFNAHNVMWDTVAEEDDMGTDIVDWCMETNTKIANDGSYTYMDRGSARKSTPDITMMSKGLNISDWGVLKPTNSDHLPVSFKVTIGSAETVRVRNIPRRTKCSFKKAD